jgi:hypothetical protein
MLQLEPAIMPPAPPAVRLEDIARRLVARQSQRMYPFTMIFRAKGLETEFGHSYTTETIGRTRWMSLFVAVVFLGFGLFLYFGPYKNRSIPITREIGSAVHATAYALIFFLTLMPCLARRYFVF